MDLAFLNPLYERPGPWSSVYVDLSAHAEDTPHQRHLTAEAMARDLKGQGADEATCDAVRDAIEELRHSSEPHGRDLFARAGEVVPGPSPARPPQGGGWAPWAPLPRVSPLLDLKGEDVVCGVTRVDRKGAGSSCTAAWPGRTPGRSPDISGRCTAPARRTGRSATSSRIRTSWRCAVRS